MEIRICNSTLYKCSCNLTHQTEAQSEQNWISEADTDIWKFKNRRSAHMSSLNINTYRDQTFFMGIS